MILIYTRGALLTALLTAVATAALYVVAPLSVFAQGLLLTVGLAMLVASTVVELAGFRSRFFFVPTWAWAAAGVVTGLVRSPTITGLVSLTVAALLCGAAFVFRAKLRFSRAVTSAQESLASVENAQNPFDAMEASCKSFLPVTRLDLVQVKHNREVIMRLLELGRFSVTEADRSTLLAYVSELDAISNGAGSEIDELTLGRAREVVAQFREKAASGLLEVDSSSPAGA